MGEPEERPHKQQRRLGAMCYLGCDGLPPGTSGGIAIALGNPNPDGSEEEVVSFLRWDWLRASPMKWREKFCNLLWRELDGKHALLDGTDYDDFHEAFHQLIFTEAGEGDLLELRERAAWLARGGRGTCEDNDLHAEFPTRAWIADHVLDAFARVCEAQGVGEPEPVGAAAGSGVDATRERDDLREV